MARLLLLFGAALIVAVPAFGGAAMRAETLVVQPLDADGSDTGRVFKKGEQVKLVLSESVTETNDSGTYLRRYDPFYCYEGCGATNVHVQLFAGVKPGPYDSILNLMPGTPKYSLTHRYTVSLYDTVVKQDGKLRFYSRFQKAVVDQRFSGNWKIQVTGGDDEETPPACGKRSLQRRATESLGCKLERVVFLQGTKFMQPAAESREAAVGQYVYFRAAISGHTLPLDLLLLFPKEVGKDGVSVARENDMVNETKNDVDCPAAASFNAKRGQFYLLCKVVKTARSGVIVRVEVPKALRGKRLEVVLAAIRRKAGQSTPEVIEKVTAGVDLDVEVPVPRTVPATAPSDPVEGHWQEVPVISRLPRAFPDADIRITPTNKEDLWIGKGRGVEIFLNRPKNENRIYDGSASGPGTGTEPIQLQLLTPGARPVFPYCAVLGLEKETILCGWWVKEPPCLACGTPIVKQGERIVVFRKVPD